MSEQWTIESVITDYMKREKGSLSRREKAFLTSVFKRLVDEGDFTKESGKPPQWIIRQLQFEQVLFTTWGHCVCGVMDRENIDLEEDPYDAPTEYLDAELDMTPEERTYWAKREKEETEKWNNLSEKEQRERLTLAMQEMSAN